MREAVKIDIDRLTEQELVDLNRRIVERLRFLESMRAHAEMLTFSVGEKMCFDPPGRGTVTGILVKYNRKSVTVVTEDGYKWNVSPHLLRRHTGGERNENRPGNVIELKPK